MTAIRTAQGSEAMESATKAAREQTDAHFTTLHQLTHAMTGNRDSEDHTPEERKFFAAKEILTSQGQES